MNHDNGLILEVSHRLGAFSLEADLTLPGRGVTALFGASGSGKTSLLRLIAGLDRPDRGRIELDGEPLVDTATRHFVPAHRRRLGVVFQEARLFPHYRVRGNLAYAMPAHMASRFEAVVGLLGIDHLLARYPATLSGGEARRVAIGRALLSDPCLLLMDEPLTGLDGARKRELLRYIQRLADEVDIPIVYVSHEPAELVEVADTLILMEQGRVRAQGKLDALMERCDLTDALGGFDAAMPLEASVQAHDGAYGLTRLGLDDGQVLIVPGMTASLGQRVRLRVPVREVALARAPSAELSYRNQLVTVIEQAWVPPGDAATMELRLRLGSQMLGARLTRKSYDELGLVVGQEVTALVRTVAFSSRDV
ncbi:molybdenum ABC transporter ATP-binding protein [Halomonas eurihalina]|uniref:Molybdenum ABC transporter ATP-binding protein n=1 Tax=Halomonas eurihalina TaxID=42566 RepID=A0A5D9DBR6_HALER|nr:molybdenum ABC transporter ATP-binding protein [Halomonas eurihalina]MDR5858119.1 molybdenum ABC transporter ATP-binding protein [Halomonas eurihalina]TZG41374.1 molybdenum ABC transporter ATP-binding protein [Halomonas eurihalina]